MYPTALEASQANNKLDIPAGPLRVQGESLRSCLESTLNPRSLFDIYNYQVPLWSEVHLWHPQLSSPSPTFTWIFNSDGTIPLVGSLDPTTKAFHGDSCLHAGYNSAAGFPIYGINYVRLPPRSKCFSAPISLGTVMDSGRISLQINPNN